MQEGRFYHGYYDEYCYLPLYVFCGRDLLLARQRCANVAGSDGAVEEVARIIAQIRQTWPRVRITLRADSLLVAGIPPLLLVRKALNLRYLTSATGAGLPSHFSGGGNGKT